MEEWFELMTLEASRQELKRVLECNQETSKYGLSLTEEEARELSRIRSRNTPGTDQGVLRFPVHPERGVCGHSGKASGDILSV